jgi:uncharacterized protein
MSAKEYNQRKRSLSFPKSSAGGPQKKESTGKSGATRKQKKAMTPKTDEKTTMAASEKILSKSSKVKITSLKASKSSAAPDLGKVALKSPVAKKAIIKKTSSIKVQQPLEQKVSVQRMVVERSLVKGLENLKEKVEAAKFYTPIRPVKEEPEIKDLPGSYGIDKIVCLVRDPYWLHTYWEITENRLREAEKYFGSEWGQTRTVLRVHDITGVSFNGENSKSHFDIELSGNAESWYINVNSPNTSFVIDITRISPSGKVFVLARSNLVTTPRDGMSDILDEQWMNLDFDKMYALSGGFKIGSTSMEMQEMMRQRLQSDISSWGGSGAVSSFGGSPVMHKRRGFWFMLDCELIVYGATEPDAKVIMQGHPINLRPDGTFTVRFALPDGVQKVETTATSADGVEERTITPTVSRNTESHEKILKEYK